MADEISMTINISLANAELTDSFAPGANKITQTYKRMHKQTLSIATTAAGTALTMGGITGKGVFYARNLDLSNFVEIGIQVAGTFHPTIKLKPGEPACGRFASATPYARADTAATVLQYGVYED